ncbi:TetR/AcrR family transcriptional regulator [Vibrio cholerae]|uniref:TetR/AcrR family transcriptional regulator n=1 Tax=Vibrio mimicus TaxID=674 RepID=UPI0001BADA28|nr:TetR/AcrR family transcriptional regulator [Vibrio mimicus]EGR4134641.1 TetR/AcrR family transcriptional regulator [Vibrio cholerae]ERM54964.1 TetR family transcriptional regulator [Vibrio mimicus CAIM 1883]ERM55004.1 TetR family transcriptional regulator [Vibrio mimicus CAIM 1882]EEY37628.1 transcriptional regulator TetR family [Vibrio mimicus MB451]ELJ8448453.1 TetR/AcrR family transcriptional regulator [Vibrio cholerae]
MPLRKAGRPSQQTQAREQLITHARELFSVMPYDKVSTRLIASKAGVDIGLIRYYFANKAGLFEAMLRETLMPMKAQLSLLVAESSHQNLTELMRTYYREMFNIPYFPRLIMQVMSAPGSDVKKQLIEKVMLDITRPIQETLFEKLLARGVIREGMDPQLCKISYLSLMIFPFVAPPALLKVHGIELSQAFLEKLVEHNIRLMEQGFITTA